MTIRDPLYIQRVPVSVVSDALLYVRTTGVAEKLTFWSVEDDRRNSVIRRGPRDEQLYTPEVLLTLMYVAVITLKDLSWAAILSLLWCAMDEECHAVLGVQDLIDTSLVAVLREHGGIHDERALPP